MSFPSSTRRWIFFSLKILLGLAGLYLLSAYVVLPHLWRHYEHNPTLEKFPKVSLTAENLPGDPLNISLVGSEEEVIGAMIRAGWLPADPITLKTAARIVVSILVHKNYPTAPVSSLYVWGRKQDLAFEREQGGSPKKRHHVRFWISPEKDPKGRPFWIGAATFDRTYGISHLTGQITHHIAPDIDAERDTLIEDLKKAGQLTELYQVTGIGATLIGYNGGGDWYYTDGELTVGVISPHNEVQKKAPTELANPLAIEIKNEGVDWLRPLLNNTMDFNKTVFEGE